MEFPVDITAVNGCPCDAQAMANPVQSLVWGDEHELIEFWYNCHNSSSNQAGIKLMVATLQSRESFDYGLP